MNQILRSTWYPKNTNLHPKVTTRKKPLLVPQGSKTDKYPTSENVLSQTYVQLNKVEQFLPNSSKLSSTPTLTPTTMSIHISVSHICIFLICPDL